MKWRINESLASIIRHSASSYRIGACSSKWSNLSASKSVYYKFCMLFPDAPVIFPNFLRHVWNMNNALLNKKKQYCTHMHIKSVSTEISCIYYSIDFPSVSTDLPNNSTRINKSGQNRARSCDAFLRCRVHSTWELSSRCLYASTNGDIWRRDIMIYDGRQDWCARADIDPVNDTVVSIPRISADR